MDDLTPRQALLVMRLTRVLQALEAGVHVADELVDRLFQQLAVAGITATYALTRAAVYGVGDWTGPVQSGASYAEQTTTSSSGVTLLDGSSGTAVFQILSAWVTAGPAIAPAAAANDVGYMSLGSTFAGGAIFLSARTCVTTTVGQGTPGHQNTTFPGGFNTAAGQSLFIGTSQGKCVVDGGVTYVKVAT